MAESQDQSEKTEEPTQKKLSDARNKGQVATSKEVNTWLILLASSILLLSMGPFMAGSVVDAVRPFVEQPHAISTDFPNLRDILLETIIEIGVALAAAALILVLAAGTAGFIQHGFVFSAHSLKPEITKISPLKGLKRMFSLKSVIELLKGIIKMALVTAVALFIVFPKLEDLPLIITEAPGDVLDRLFTLGLYIFASVVGAMTVIAIIDFIYQKFEYTKQQRMSKQEIKDEQKQLEGDPMVRARLRSLRMERARNRMMTAVPTADVVITNPTHYAVALKYDPDVMEAPTMVAKGSDLIAKRIREIAEENRVPIMRNPPLCRALHAAMDIDDTIPLEHYKTVAEIISYVWRLKGKMAPGSAGAGPRPSPN